MRARKEEDEEKIREYYTLMAERHSGDQGEDRERGKREGQEQCSRRAPAAPWTSQSPRRSQRSQARKRREVSGCCPSFLHMAAEPAFAGEQLTPSRSSPCSKQEGGKSVRRKTRTTFSHYNFFHFILMTPGGGASTMFCILAKNVDMVESWNRACTRYSTDFYALIDTILSIIIA